MAQQTDTAGQTQFDDGALDPASSTLQQISFASEAPDPPLPVLGPEQERARERAWRRKWAARSRAEKNFDD